VTKLISEKPVNIAFLSAYPPGECGPAAFAQGIVMQLNASRETIKGNRNIRVTAWN